MNFRIISSIDIWKWNLINMLNLKGQLIDASMQGQTHSSIFEFLLAMTIYIIVFVLVSVIFLNKKTFNKELSSIEYVVRATIKEEGFVSSQKSLHRELHSWGRFDYHKEDIIFYFFNK